MVDDTLDTLKALAATLVADGHAVRPVPTGRQALEAMAQQPPELVLCDVRMPGMDGFEVCRAIKADPALASVPVILLSSTEEGGERVRGFEAGAVDFIPKPFVREELLARVRAHLELSRLRERLEALVEDRTEHLREATARLEVELAERKAAEAERIRLQTLLQRSQKLECIGNLAGGVAHDFNNMLTIILCHAQMGISALPESDPVRKDLGEIFAAGKRSANLTRQLLAFARNQPVAPVVLDLGTALPEMLNMLRRLIGDNISLVWNAPLEPVRVRIDPSQLDQILANLCVNARDAIGGAGKVDIAVDAVEVGPRECREHPGLEPGDFARIRVRDDGCGMAPEIVEQIFDPFFTTKEVGKGTGLGLSTVYGIVKQNKGAIEVESRPGEGTEFAILLPRSKEEVSAEVVVRKSRSAPAGRTVLVVDDSGSVLDTARDALVRAGWRVDAAASPEEAVEMVRQKERPVDLVLADVVMPRMDGVDLVDRIRRIRPGIRWLLMTGGADTVRGLAAQGDPKLLQKPFSAETLLAKVSEALDGY